METAGIPHPFGGAIALASMCAAARAQDPTSRESLAQALEDPLVIDVVLHEGGLFEHSLDDRVALLPEDEGLLGRAWTLLEWVAALERPPVVVGPDGELIDLDALSSLPAPDAPLSGPDVEEAMLGFIEEQEQRWCEEPVPALGGVTPKEAAADPTRRDELQRLIASFPPADFSSGVFTMRPEKLRERLDLPAS